MPIQGEKSRKIKLLRQGKNVRPPKRFWVRMMRIITREYPQKSNSERAQILGGMWQKYTTQVKINIIKEFQI